VRLLNPHKEAGRLTLITRYGESKIESVLPQHIAAVKSSGVPVIWVRKKKKKKREREIFSALPFSPFYSSKDVRSVSW
jgi:hypothetical protein